MKAQVVVACRAEPWWSMTKVVLVLQDRVGIWAMTIEVHPIRVGCIAHGGVAGLWSPAASLALHQDNTFGSWVVMNSRSCFGVAGRSEGIGRPRGTSIVKHERRRRITRLQHRALNTNRGK